MIDRAIRVAGQAVQSLGASGEQLGSAHRRALDTARRYVQANPLAALGIAIGAGYLPSRLMQSN